MHRKKYWLALDLYTTCWKFVTSFMIIAILIHIDFYFFELHFELLTPLHTILAAETR